MNIGLLFAFNEKCNELGVFGFEHTTLAAEMLKETDWLFAKYATSNC